MTWNCHRVIPYCGNLTYPNRQVQVVTPRPNQGQAPPGVRVPCQAELLEPPYERQARPRRRDRRVTERGPARRFPLSQMFQSLQGALNVSVESLKVHDTAAGNSKGVPHPDFDDAQNYPHCSPPYLPKYLTALAC
eukprot:758423-Hanusia_phi.AAC.1